MSRPRVHTSLPLIISASQISLFRECKRKYAFQYVAEIKSPATPAQELGTDVDDNQLQPYLREGRDFDLTKPSGPIAAAGVLHLPKPMSPGLEVQKQFLMPSPTLGTDGKPLFGYLGYLDLWLPDGMYMPGLVGGNPCVGDFKTAKNWNYIKKAEDLAVDSQAQLYATWAMWATGKREVDLVWLYLRTTGKPKARRVHLRVDGSHVLSQFLDLDKTGQEIAALRAGAKDKDPIEYALSLEPNLDACSKFGGCPHRFRCNLGPADMIEGDNLVDVDVNDAVARLKAKKAALLAGTTKAEEPVPEALTKPYQAKSVEGARILGINPPEKDLPREAPGETSTMTIKSDGEIEIKTSKPIEVSAPVEEPMPARGRPRGSKNKKVGEQVVKVDEKQLVEETEAVAIPSAEAVIAELVKEDEAAAECVAHHEYGQVRITWQHNGFTYEVTTHPMKDERLGDALRRLDAQLYGFSIERKADGK